MLEETEVNLSEEDEEILNFSTHPGLDIFQLKNALTYFNKDTILRNELNDNIEFYLEDGNIYLAIERIFDMESLHNEQSVTYRNCASCTCGGRPPSKKKGATNSYNNEKSSRLVKRLRLDLSLQDIEMDNSSVCESSSSTTSKATTNIDGDVKSSSDTDGPKRSEKKMDIGDCGFCKKYDLVSLLWLMSVLPEPAAFHCKKIMDRDECVWKVNLYDIIMIFLNWGATLKSLGLKDVLGCSSFKPQQPSLNSSHITSKHDFPRPCNVSLVLTTIGQRLPSESQMSFRRRVLLVRILVFAVLDKSQRCNMTTFCRTIHSVLDSFENWDEDKACMIVSDLDLKRVGAQNAVFVCCCIFSMVRERSALVGLLACHNVLHRLYSLPSEPCFIALVNQLVLIPDPFERFKKSHIYIITQLTHDLLVRYSVKKPPCPKETVEKLHDWTTKLHDILKKYPNQLSVESGHLRERLTRLSSECVNTVRVVYSNSIHGTFNFQLQNDVDDVQISPCKQEQDIMTD